MLTATLKKKLVLMAILITLLSGSAMTAFAGVTFVCTPDGCIPMSTASTRGDDMPGKVYIRVSGGH